MDEVALRLRGVSLVGDGGRAVVDGVDWEVARGGTGVVVGASGSGKSRLLRLVNRLDERAAGSIEVLGRDIDDWDVVELRRTVAWVPQRPALVPGRAADVLDTPVRIGSVGRDEADERAGEALDVAGIDEALLARSVDTLSGGERLRLALARALLLAPEILLLDEPTSALDGAAAAGLLDRIAAWRERHGATLVVVTHRDRDVRALGGELLVLDDGAVAAAGPAAALLEDPDVLHLMTGEEPS